MDAEVTTSAFHHRKMFDLFITSPGKKISFVSRFGGGVGEPLAKIPRFGQGSAATLISGVSSGSWVPAQEL